MRPSDLALAGLVRADFEKQADFLDQLKSYWDTFSNDVKPQWRDAAVGTLGGGLLAGTIGSATGRGFFAPALGGALLGGTAGYFRKPFTDGFLQGKQMSQESEAPAKPETPTAPAKPETPTAPTENTDQTIR